MSEKPVQSEEASEAAIVKRRFGRNHDKPCHDPHILTCAMWECQKANGCRKPRNGMQN